jgi:two-component system nitrogen regulation response regulator NtrX
MTGAAILVVDDEASIRSTIRDILADEGYRVETAADAAEARTHYRGGNPDLVLLDIWMPDTDGITLLKEWSDDAGLNCPVVVMSGHGTVETAVEATRLGAFDFVEKPLSLQQLLSTVETALAQCPKNVRNAGVGVSPVTLGTEIPQGNSTAIRAAREQAQEIAAQTVPALVTGEPGVGRDLFGRLIHSLSSRADGPFIVVNGAALTDESCARLLVGSEQDAGRGLLAQAAGGTLFISEVQGLSSQAQNLLLSIVEQGDYRPADRTTSEPLRARLLASVQRNGTEAVRPDLLAALGVMQLSVPPLRDYSEDIPELLRFYVHRFVAEEGFSFRRFGVASQNRLRNYPWPGNLRELKNLVRRLLLKGGLPEVSLTELEACLAPAPTSGSEPLVQDNILALPLREAREHFERAYLAQQLKLCGGKVGKLAARVGMERTHLYRKLRALGVDFGQSSADE